jgi:hypothetical protein
MRNVFSTMLSQSVDFKAAIRAKRPESSPSIPWDPRIPRRRFDRFVGEANGVVYIYMHQDVAFQIASAMTGMGRARGEGRVRDRQGCDRRGLPTW